MPPRVFIDGQAGTTGLSIHERLRGRADLELLEIDPARRKDSALRAELLRAADLAILCLPDAGAREAVELVAGAPTRLLDASTAHRVADGWVYGLPELAPDQRESIARARLVSNPGCYPTGVSLLLRPLLEAGLLPSGLPVAIHALSGYSGGGRALIERWEDPGNALQGLVFEAPYALDRVHKHIPEMTRHAGLDTAPQFVPAVGPFRRGMRIQVPVHASWLAAAGAAAADLWGELQLRYSKEPFVRLAELGAPTGDEKTLDPRCCNGTNRIDLHVLPNPAGHVLLVAVLDNLGKGAGGAAVQNLNLMLGIRETEGL